MWKLARLKQDRPVTLGVARGRRRLMLRASPSPDRLQPLASEVVVVGARRVGRVTVRQFTPGVAAAARTALEKMRGDVAEAFVLDLRRDPGGLLDEAVEMAGVFGAPALGEKERADGRREAIQAHAAPLGVRPLVVLVDGGTASAAEFVAAALKNTPGVRVIGSVTAGRAQAQTFVPLTGGWGLVIPSVRLRDRDGVDLKRSAVSPDTPAGPGDAGVRRAESLAAADVV